LIQQELLKSGKSEVAEPTVISTYVFTPRGRELMTIGNKYFERSGETSQNSNPSSQSKDIKWADKLLPEYFAGQKLENKEAVTSEAPLKPEESGFEKEVEPQTNEKKTEKEEVKTPDKMQITSFPTFGYDTCISPVGLEMISSGDIMYARKDTTSKVWEVTNLIEYFTDQIVINALPDSPDEQLPTIRLKTHAFSPDQREVVTYKDRFWERKLGTSEWKTGLLKEYFEGQTTKDSQFPVTHWDIHTFSPVGTEIVIVGLDVWSKASKSPDWKKQSIEEYFGKNLPLDKEVEEKEKLDEQTDIKKYQVIKDKVMNELLKFFRPELVNRFDEVIVFEPLKFKHMLFIVVLQLKSLAKLLE
jgi:hypothetical protein